MSTPTLVVIDDDDVARQSVAQMLELRGYTVRAFDSAEKVLASQSLGDASCVITDVKMPGMDGEEFLAQAVGLPGAPPIIMITGHGDVAMAVRCLKAGAFDFVEKPFDDDVLLAYVTKAVEQSRLMREADALRRQLTDLSQVGAFGMIGRSRAMQEVYARIDAAARSAVPVLILGETGAGKELVARAVHAHSSRSRGPFVPVNAGALPENTLESELFGHAKGSFTGAVGEREGKLLCASGGTLFLDEIESISARAQVQLLRVLDDGIVEPLGSDRPRKVDVRLLTASNVDLQQEVKKGTIREDFYHRIMVLSICVPPLRQRAEDIPVLVSHFMRSAAERNGTSVPRVSEETLAALVAHAWPGNVRELKNAVERMLITSQGGQAGGFVPDMHPGDERLLSLPGSAGRLHDELERVEKRVIEEALRANHGEIEATYRYLGISRRALYERMKKYGLSRREYP